MKITYYMDTKINVLLVEDERMLAEILSDTLGDRNFGVTLAYDGVQALEIAAKEHFDVIVTDIMMPNMDGFTLVKKLRSKGCTTPVLFLTARSATEDLVKGFEIGGNDYLKKPFAIDELIVRVRALAGRVSKDRTADATYRLGNYIYSPSAGTLEFAHDTTIKLAARENAVLLHLCRNMGNTVEASDILKELWGDDNFFNLRSLNVYISKLRNHLSKDPLVEITSIRGVGYRLETRK